MDVPLWLPQYEAANKDFGYFLNLVEMAVACYMPTETGR